VHTNWELGCCSTNIQRPGFWTPTHEKQIIKDTPSIIHKAVTKRDGQYTYRCDFDGLSSKNFCRGNPVSFTYSECVSAALVILQAMRMRHIFICGLSGSNEFL
jgi:hypothetical protein